MSTKLQWSIACLNSAVDQETNSLSLFDILEEIQIGIANALPSEGIFVPRPLRVVSLWQKESEGAPTFETKLVLESPSKEILMECEDKLQIPEGKMRQRHIIGLQGLRIKEGGRHNFLIYKKEDEQKEYELITSIPFEVKIEVVNKKD